MAGKVKGEHAVALGQRGQQLDPVQRPAAEPVQEHERSAGAAGEIPDRDAAHVGASIGQPTEARCDRHAEEVSWGYEGLGGAGPLNPAQTTRAVAEPA